LRQHPAETTMALVGRHSIRTVLLSFALAAEACLRWAQPDASAGRVRVIILYSRHLGAHGLGYNERSLRELSEKLSPADIPAMITLLSDQKVRVGAQFALASQCEASIVPVREAAKRHELDFLEASDVMSMISSFSRCSPEDRAQARAMCDELDKLRREDQARIAAEAKRKAENDARIQENGLMMMDPKRAKELTRQEREEVYHRSVKAMGLDENGPMTPAQKQMVDRMYRTMVLGEAGSSANR
jgi:hypothetical protein